MTNIAVHDDHPMTREERAPRIELLIAPREVFSGRAAGMLITALGRTLTVPRCLRLGCGDDAIAHVADATSSGSLAGPPPGGLQLIEGLWPEPLGLRLTASTQQHRCFWQVESDRYGVRPLFYAFDTARRPLVSTRPDILAAIIGAAPSRQSIAEHLLVGYNLDDHTPFENVFRLRPGERLLRSDDAGFNISPTTFPDALPRNPGGPYPPWLEVLTEIIVSAMQRGDALELTGGVDSRLVLAVALAAGVRPPLSFTLGEDDDEDVRLASLICRRLGIRHLALPVLVDERTIASDAHSFVIRSGFASNACSYGWLPGVFDRLADRRNGQIGGCGGEFGTGIHCPSLDRFGGLTAVRRLWARLRLIDDDAELIELFGREEGGRLVVSVEETLVAATRRAPTTRRARFDGFYFDHYLTQRMPMASGGVLAASACWYRPLQPFMHGAYIEWARSLRTSHCADRAVQIELLHALAPSLAGLRRAGRRKQRRPLIKALGKISRRWRGRRAAPDQGAPLVAHALARSDAVRHALQHLIRHLDLERRADHVDRLLASPHAHARELGVLISFAWAADAADSLARDLHESDGARPRRRAA